MVDCSLVLWHHSLNPVRMYNTLLLLFYLFKKIYQNYFLFILKYGYQSKTLVRPRWNYLTIMASQTMFIFKYICHFIESYGTGSQQTVSNFSLISMNDLPSKTMNLMWSLYSTFSITKTITGLFTLNEFQH